MGLGCTSGWPNLLRRGVTKWRRDPVIVFFSAMPFVSYPFPSLSIGHLFLRQQHPFDSSSFGAMHTSTRIHPYAHNHTHTH
ncbi:hypothetical protein BC939DRAFT_168821 [Gamsiella multidivaricata]|uniref:uncharacterized protein n=1 Tax=Gamsiella multidivaricata TaxID=101098 RepID=UPI00221FE483|nr:uncharacterized protein BC939DRAFT_168821 [Gamsiella multidivaricata]KAI7822965.1 hypothetical protein BC939DRAFT_168821 [Gamsiella multidivaricata]